MPLSKFVSTPNMPNNSSHYSSDEDEANDEDQSNGPIAMETDAKPRYLVLSFYMLSLTLLTLQTKMWHLVQFATHPTIFRHNIR